MWDLLQYIPKSRNFNPMRKASIIKKTNLGQHVVYVLSCADDTLYVGCTNNIEKRFKEHNDSKRGAHYTKIRRPVKLVHTEIYKTLKDARAREAEIKRMPRTKKVVLIGQKID